MARKVFVPGTPRGIIVRVALLLAIVFALFEIGIRLLPPDALQYSEVETINGTVTFSTSGTITDPATIAEWQADVTATPSDRFIWQTNATCAPLSEYSASYTFLWHGLPIEVVSQLPSCLPLYEVSSGGIPNPRAYNVGFLIAP